MTSKGPRKPLELRPLRMEVRRLAHQDGSALFAFGPVSALAAVSGPSEVRIRDERTDRAALQIHFTPLQGMAGTSAVEFEQSLSGIWTYAIQLHLYPRALIQLHLQTYSSPSTLAPRPFVESSTSPSSSIPKAPPVQPPHPDAPISCSLKAAHINATTLACLDAAITMRCLVAAASAAVVKKGLRANRMRGWRAGEQTFDAQGRDADGDVELENVDQSAFEIVLDPSPYEESLAKSVHTFAFAFELAANKRSAESNAKSLEDDLQTRLRPRLVYNESQGTQEGKEYFDCLALCRQASQDIVVQMRKSIQAR